MRSLVIHRSRLPLCLLILAAALGGCRQGARSATPPPPPVRAAASPAGVSAMDPTGMRLSKVDMLISQWDVAQASGRKEQADMLVGQIRQEVDLGYTDFVAASRGSMGVQMQYLGVSALGFSGRSDATRVLVECLRQRDPKLLGNALIALKIRADPNTPLDPLIQQLRSPASEGRRYAPLAIANVLEAKRRQGRPASPEVERQIVNGLSAIVADRDPLVRLHVGNALGKVSCPGTYELLMVLMKDEYVRVRIAGAAGLERLGDARGMPEVIRLLDDVDQELKPIVEDLLISYAARVQGQSLTEAERKRLGTSGLAWSHWYTDFATSHGIPLPSAVRSPAASIRSAPPAAAAGASPTSPPSTEPSTAPGAQPASPWSSTPGPSRTRAQPPTTVPQPPTTRVERAPMPSPPPPPPPPPPIR